MVGTSRLSLFVACGVVAAACSGSGTVDAISTSTSEPSAPSSIIETSTTVTVESTTTSASAVPISPPRYQIVERITTDAPGDTVVVLLDVTSYESLTDIDLFDIIAEVVELFPPISEVHVVDDLGAANTVIDPNATSQDIQAIESNYLARLENGFTITYLGPFASSGSAELGS